MNQLRTLIVCGATGRQGGAVLDALLESRKWNVIAISRNTSGHPAEEIKKKGIPVLQADLADKASLINAFKGGYGVFGITMPIKSNGKPDLELEWRQGQNIVEACLLNQVQHLVMSTVIHVEEGQEKTLEYIKYKVEIENLIKKSQLPYTFLCPGPFMDDFGEEYMPVKNNVIKGMLASDAKNTLHRLP